MQLNLETALNFLWTTCIIFSVNHNYQCKLSELISIKNSGEILYKLWGYEYKMI
jgi:hypothetical protein